MTRGRAVLLGLALLLGFAAARIMFARADSGGHGKSYCAGGFEFDRGGNVTRDECGGLRSRHPNAWHFHSFVKRRDGKCYACWDEEDATCDTLLPVEHPDFRAGTSDPSTCKDLPPAEPKSGNRVYEPDPATTVTPQPTVKPTPSPTATPSPSADPGVTPSTPPTPDPSTLRIPPAALPEPDDDDDIPAPLTSPGPGQSPRPTQRPKPKPPRVVPLTAQITHVSQGPFAVGDPVQVEAVVIGDDGRMRRSRAGDIVVTDQAGVEKLRVPVTAQPSGAVTAEIKLPIAGALQITYVPTSITLPPSEKEGPVTSTPAPISASSCRLRGFVLSPKTGEILVAQAPLTLRGQIRNLAGAAIAPADLNGAKAVFTVDLSGGRSFKLDATVSSSGEATAPLTLPTPTDSTEDVVIRLLGEGGAGDFCGDAPVTARTTLLGIGLTMSLPRNCYNERECDIGGGFQLPESPAARTAGLAFLGSPDLEVVVWANGGRVGKLKSPAPADPASAWTGTFTPPASGVMDIELVATAGGKEVREKRTVRIREPIELRLAEELDLGTVAAGSEWGSTCKTIDFGNSRGVAEQTFIIESTKPKGCVSRPALRAGGMVYRLSKPSEFELDKAAKLGICLADVPRCSPESPAPVELTIRAKSPDFPDQIQKVRLKWKVSGRNFWACHWWWLVAAAGVLLVLFVGYGYVSPYSFAVHDAVKLASKREGLARATARRLRELPGGRSGFYRSATTGLREDGSATNKLGTASVILRARKGEVILDCRGGLTRVNPQSKKLEPVDTGKDGHIASKNIIYNVGSLFFQLS